MITLVAVLAMVVLTHQAEYFDSTEGLQEGVTVLDFSEGIPVTFYNQNDGVMGGVSTGSLSENQQEKAAEFSGTTLTANDGGFSFVTSVPSNSFKVPNKEGVRLVVKGDGRTYRISFKMSAFYFAPQYFHDFETTDDGEFSVIQLPFKDFVPQFFGSATGSSTPLDSGRIVEIGFMHSKFTMFGLETFPDWQEGDFKLLIRSVEYI